MRISDLMALVAIWSFEPLTGNWITKLVDPANLQPRTQQNYWMLKVMERPPAPSLRPPWWRPPRPPGTDYVALARAIPERAAELDHEERAHRAWSLRRTKQLRADLAAIAKRIEERQAQAQAAKSLIRFALDRLSDHDFICAMFSLYSQQRCRLI